MDQTTTASTAPGVATGFGPIAAPQPAPSSMPASVSAVNSPIISPSPTTVSTANASPQPIDYASIQQQLNAIKAQALKIQSSAATLNDNNTVDHSGVITSSGTEVQNEKNVTDSVNNLSANNGAPGTPLAGLTAGNVPGSNADGTGPDVSGAQGASDKYMATLQNYMANLEARRASEVSSIGADFEQQQKSLENTQGKETGSTTAMLARSGGYLGASGSGTGVLLNLAQTHANEMANLEQKKQSAIQAAKVAIDDKEFAVAESMAKQATDIEKTINDRKQQFFDNTQKVIEQQRNDSEFQKSKVQDDLKSLSLLDPTTIPDDKKKQIDDYYGTPGFTDKYIASVQAAAKAKTQGDVLSNQKTLLDMLQSIPEGKTVVMPDGTQYTGVGKTSDVTTFMQVDNNGVGHVVSYNKATGQTSVQSVGPVGKTSSAGNAIDPTTKDNIQALLQQRLEQSKDKTSGQYDPETYIKERELIKQAFPSLVSELDRKFLNPSNSFFSDDAINNLRKQGIYVGAAALADPASPVIPNQEDTSISPGQ